MRILLLSNAESSHTIKWAKSLVDQGNDVGIFSLSDCDSQIYKEYPSISLYIQGFSNKIIRRSGGHWEKLKYLRTVFSLRKVIREWKPEIVHAHYASSYGILGALSNFRPYVLSVWGSDVFDFPHTSVLHKLILKYNLFKADKVLSTSHVMAKETGLYTTKLVEVTPFGIDLDYFKPKLVKSFFTERDIIIGTVKTLEEKYGIEYLIRAFAILRDKHPNLPLKLLIVGGGSQEEYLKELAQELGIASATVFTGRIPYDKVVEYHNMLSVSVSVSVSDSESFGVAVIEASACEKPVVVARVGGLPEVVEDGVTGFIVEPRNPEQTAMAIENLVVNQELRRRMGQEGRNRVRKLFNWQNNVEQMVNIYQKVLKENEDRYRCRC